MKVIVDQRSQPSTTQRPGTQRRTVVSQDTEIDLAPGDSTQLLCSLRPRSSNPRTISTTSWFKGERSQKERFPNNFRPNQETLQIIRFKPSDAGKYTCSLSSSDGTYQTIVVTIKVRDQDSQPTEAPVVPPTAQIEPKQKLANEGDSFELTCSVTGKPEPRIVWLFNDQFVENLSGVFARGSTLYVRDATPALNGVFICRAVGTDDRTAQDTAVVRVQPKPTTTQAPIVPEAQRNYQVEVVPNNPSVDVGSSIQLECKVIDQDTGAEVSGQDLRITWSRAGGVLPGSAEPSTDGSLMLYNMKEQESGTYVCEVFDAATSNELQGYSQVIVNSPRRPDEPSEPLSMYIEPKNANLVQGREFELKCVVRGGKNPKVTWTKVGGSLDPSRHFIIGNNLLIRNAQPEDRGYFECLVQAEEDQGRDYAIVEVEQREAPKLELFPQESRIEIGRGEYRFAQCRVISGAPAPTVEWRRADGRGLSSKVNIGQEGSLLQIQDFGDAEFGTYECVASNSEGEAKGSISFVLRDDDEERRPERPEPENGDEAERQRAEDEARRRAEEERRRQEQEREEEPEEPREAPLVNVAARRVQAREGDKITLLCSTTTTLPHRIDWLTPNAGYVAAEADGSLVLPKANKDESGTYTCVVTNAYGSTRVDVDVEIVPDKDDVMSVRVTPKSRTVHTGDSIDLTCEVKSSDRNPSIKWSRPGNAALPEEHQASGNMLRIQNAKPEDSGRYLCVAQTNDNKVGFDAAYLSVTESEPETLPVYIKVLSPPSVVSPTNIAYKFGSKFEVDCSADGDVEQLQWKKLEGDVEGEPSRASISGDSGKQTMILNGAVNMDLGTYICEATRGDGSKAQNAIHLLRDPNVRNQFVYKIDGPSEADDSRPKPTPKPEERESEKEQPEQEREEPRRPEPEARRPETEEESAPEASIRSGAQVEKSEGENVEIICDASGSPEPTVRWEKHGGDLGDNVRVRGNALK